MDRLSILAITNFYPPQHGGGYGLQMGWFCDRLAEQGHTLRVLTTGSRSGETVGETSPYPVSRELLHVDGDPSSRELLHRTLHNRDAVRRAVRACRPEVVFCGGFDGVGFNTYLAAIESGTPTFTWLGDTWLGQAWRDLRQYDAWAALASGGKRPGLRRAVKRALGAYGRFRGLYDGSRPRTFGPVGTLSQFVLDDLRQTAAPVSADARVISVNLHPAFFTAAGDPIGHGGRRSPELRALFVGRMELLKGPDTAVRAVAVARSNGADVRLSFAGLRIDELRQQLTELATSLGVADRIAWCGTPDLAQLIELYRTHDVFLFPSRIVEGLGVVNIEALACGLPVIGTAHSGSAEVIIHGESGFRVLKDDFEAMGRYLTELHTDRGLLQKLSDAAPGFARRFAPVAVIRTLEEELFKTAQRPVRSEALT